MLKSYDYSETYTALLLQIYIYEYVCTVYVRREEKYMHLKIGLQVPSI